MRLSSPPGQYSPVHESRRNADIELADRQNLKRGQDVETQGRIILKAPNGTRWALQVSNAGALSAVAV